MSFPKIFQILFIVGSTFLIFIPEYLNNSWWSFSSSFSVFEDQRRIYLQSYPFSRRFMVLALCHPVIIVFGCGNYFHPSGATQKYFQFHSSEPSFHNYSFQLSSLVLQILSVHRSNILYSVHDLFVLMYLNSFKYLHSFSNSSWRILPLLHSFSILTVVLSTFLFCCYRIN